MSCARKYRQSGYWEGNLIAAVVLSAFVLAVYFGLDQSRKNAAEAQNMAALEAAQAASERAQVEAASRAGWAALNTAERIEQCVWQWRYALGFDTAPQALALTESTLIGYYLDADDAQSLRPVHCSAYGIEQAPRIERPLRDRLPAEQATGDRSSAAWSLALTRVSADVIAGELLAIELLVDPTDGAVWRRDWRGLEGGAVPTLSRLTEDGAQPADGVDFPLLFVAAFPFRERYPGLPSVLPVIDWLHDPNRILDFLETRAHGRGISEISVADGMLTVQTVGPIPAFDGDPPTPFGERTFDSQGVATASIWYPREIPGFGCARGATVAALRQSLQATWTGVPLARIWYSCSPAHGDGVSGQWTLQPATN